jgi:hypothetical protein
MSMKTISMDKGFHKYLAGGISLIGALLLFWHSLLPLLMNDALGYCLLFIGVSFMLRYPHEYVHWLAGKLLGIGSSIDFKRLNATCTPKRDMDARELIIFAMAPLCILGSVIIALVAAPLPKSLHLVFVGVGIYHVFACYFDVIYVFYALKYRDKRFTDAGLGLQISK